MTRALLHPTWCVLDGCDVALQDSRRLAFAHVGEQSSWLAVGDDARLSTELTRLDELNGHRHDVGDVAVRLAVRSTALLNSDGSPIFADVHLSPSDCDTLVHQLKALLGELRHQGCDVPADMLLRAD